MSRLAGALRNRPSRPFIRDPHALVVNQAFLEESRGVGPSLLSRARGGDAEAFCELVRDHEARLLRQAMMLCGNEAQAEDLAQDTLVEAWRCLRRYDARCRFFTWLCAILLHRYRNTVRGRRLLAMATRPGSEAGVGATCLSSLADPAPLPDEVSQQRERAERVLACVHALRPKHQQVIYLRFYADDSLEGIAAALGCSVGTVKSRLFHALEKLRGMNRLARRPGNEEETL